MFDAHTQAAFVRKWLTGPPGWSFVVCDIDLRVGGKLRYVWRSAMGHDMGMTGTFCEIERPARIVHTEVFDEDWTGGETRVTTIFEETDERRPSR